MNSTFLYIWFSLMLITFIAAPLVRKARKQNAPTSQDFVSAAFALGGVIALIRVLIKVLTQTQLQADLELDGTIALSIGSALGTYLALKEVVTRLF
ncbi:MAG: hypothetical protein WBB01_09855 [Phormidesmis sp.]